MGLPREEQTRRIIAAIESGDIDVVGHPTGRIIEHRPPYDVDMEAIVEAAARTGVALELNAYPDRLDLNDEHAKLARDRGAWIVIDTDSHATSHLYAMQHGIEVARRAWLEPKHVLNTRSVDELVAHRAARRASARHSRKVPWSL
jgi:DNA polymerase (family 10)